MVLIISSKSDLSTNHVIDWIQRLGGSSVRLNGEDFSKINSENISIETVFDDTFVKTKIHYNGNFDKFLISSDENITGIWFRRDKKALEEIKQIAAGASTPESSKSTIERFLNKEHEAIKHGIYSILTKGRKMLGNYASNEVNKINVLNIAKQVGLKIPPTLLTNDKNVLKDFLINYKSIITKPAYESLSINCKDKTLSLYVEEIDLNDISEFPPFFFPSLFQAKIEKEYEIRTFVLNGSFYSMAIFSQADTQTQTDFRRYNQKRPSRCVPYILPKGIEKKVNKLLNNLNLNTASLDFVKCKQGELFFLEVNPVGQYGMVSLPCNYLLDKQIAKFLIN